MRKSTSPYDYIFDEKTLVKTPGENLQDHCTVTVTCNTCQNKKATLKFDMPNPSYKHPADSFGMYYGYSMHLCMWYCGCILDKGWGRSSSGIYCPECWEKECKHQDKVLRRITRWDWFWNGIDKLFQVFKRK